MVRLIEQPHTGTIVDQVELDQIEVGMITDRRQKSSNAIARASIRQKRATGYRTGTSPDHLLIHWREDPCMSTSVITGITGQDDAYLTQQLLERGHKVYGTFRRTSSVNFWR